MDTEYRIVFILMSTTMTKIGRPVEGSLETPGDYVELWTCFWINQFQANFGRTFTYWLLFFYWLVELHVGE